MVFKKNTFSAVIIGFLGITLILFITAFSLSLARNADITRQISSKYNMINKFVSKSRMPITEESVVILTGKRNMLKDVYAGLKAALATPLNEKIPEKGMGPLQFKERLVQTRKKLRADAEKHNLALPASLGFTKYETELSGFSEIPFLIRRLKVLKELLHLMAVSRVGSLNKLSFIGGIAEEGDSAGAAGLCFDIPLSFEINCATPELIDFLYKLKVSRFIFIVEDMDVKKTENAPDESVMAGSMLEINFLIRAAAID